MTAEPTEVVRGIQQWTKNGFLNLRVHYTADPAKDPKTVNGAEWFFKAKSGYPTRDWSREMEIDFDVPQGKPVYCDTDRIIVEPLMYKPYLKLFRGWDFGFNVPVCIAGHVERMETDEGIREVVYILREFSMPHTIVDTFSDYVLDRSRYWFPAAKVVDYGDPAGNQKSDKNNKTSIEILQSKSVTCITTPMPVERGINIVQLIISAGHMHIDPSCRVLLTSLRDGYVRDEKGEPIGGELGHPYGDHADALRYWLANFFQFHNADRVGGTYRPPEGLAASSGFKSRPEGGADGRRRVYRPMKKAWYQPRQSRSR